jgi:hypothetical protein
LLSSTLLAIFVTPSLYTLLDDLQSLIFRPAPSPAIPSERVAVPAPVAERTWLGRLRAGRSAGND